ncbi:hypothetical protein PRIPAC_83865 [Pristionchus pacificus]|uniref:F-box domain-containing protein n=1 Tax=Pristionchus pacificus TaxID=54126 RepID=A0A2A6BU15_PRIPA|nr:hypothetical protein PRIPAC_83865 [Pristionchus pacificus]|eukprot:PDM69241.1 F-box domain-containing protein [Pristionchus pacificus]
MQADHSYAEEKSFIEPLIGIIADMTKCDLSGSRENEEGTSFLDLPNEVIAEIFKYLDVRTRLRMRINRRLDKIELGVKNAVNCDIRLGMRTNGATMHVEQLGIHDKRIDDLSLLESGFRRLAGTTVKIVRIEIEEQPTEEQRRIVDELLNLNMKDLYLLMNEDLPVLAFPRLLRLIENGCDFIVLRVLCDSITVKDLCTLRKIILNSTMQFFSIYVRPGIAKSFAEECFKINIDESTDNTPQITSHTPGSELQHMESDLITNVHKHTTRSGETRDVITFMKEGYVSEMLKSKCAMSVTRRGEKSFLDLPNEVIIEVFKYLNLPTRLRMRLNKRLDKIALGLKNAENIGNITLTICTRGVKISVPKYGIIKTIFDDISVLEHSFRRIAEATVNRIQIYMSGSPSEQQCQVLEQVLNLNCKVLRVDCMNGNLSFLTLSQLLRLMENSCESIVLHTFCDSLTMEDLCRLRKIMLTNNMQFFNLHVRQEMLKIFVNECFGINFDEPILNLPQIIIHTPGSQMRHAESGLITFVNTHTNWEEDVHGEIIFMRDGFDRFSMN